ncbi:MAG: DUF342 domain-containing protein [Acidobacteria bacterium]|nr:DUF342 domain-containing protein [Acidobacteriota bacterium]
MPSSIRFQKKGINNSLLAVTIEPSGDFPLGIPMKSIQSWIRQQGCESWQQDESAISRFARQARQLDESREYVLAERKDCCVDVKVSPDRLKAWVAVTQAFGGEPFSEKLLADILEANHITFGIKKDVLREIQKTGWSEKKLIAEGVSPVEGEKAKFVPLVEESEHKGIPQEREDGSVDYKDLGLYITVSEGTPLLKHFPPTEGSPGKGVDGKPIPTPPVRDRVLLPGVGSAISPDDPSIIIATRAGKPFYDDNSVRVDPTLEVNKVDPSTGNVIFDGNIVVWGPVEAGYTIQAGHDLTILDTVEGADLIAGNDITLVTGIYGRGKSKISLKGNLMARFLNDCTIQCGGNIDVTDLMSHCFVECQGALHLGELGGKGQIIGGNIQVLEKAQARIIGSISEITTRIAVGPSKELLSKIARIKEEIEQLQHDLKIIGKPSQAQLKQGAVEGSQGFEDLKAKQVALVERLKSLEEEGIELQNKLDSSRNGLIKAEEVYHGAILSVGTKRKRVDDLTTDFYLFQPVNEN